MREEQKEGEITSIFPTQLGFIKRSLSQRPDCTVHRLFPRCPSSPLCQSTISGASAAGLETSCTIFGTPPVCKSHHDLDPQEDQVHGLLPHCANIPAAVSCSKKINHRSSGYWLSVDEHFQPPPQAIPGLSVSPLGSRRNALTPSPVPSLVIWEDDDDEDVERERAAASALSSRYQG